MSVAIVTGGAGFIGSALCRRLLAEPGQQVVVVDKLTYAASRASIDPLIAPGRLRLVEADIADAGAMASVFEDARPDTVYHLAAETHVDRSIDGAAPFIETNVGGTFTLLETARAYLATGGAPDGFRFLHVSTDEVFGALGPEGAFDETTPYDPSSPYSASKAASDHLVRAWHRTYGLPVLITNCTNNYGPRQFPEKLIPLMIQRALAGLTLPVYGDGLQVRDWLHVDDHAEALVTVAKLGRPGETYAVGARCERTNLDLVQTLCAALDRLRPAGAPHSRRITHVEDRPGHDRRYAIDPSRIEAELGWRPAVDFEDGLAATVAWYLDNVAWWRPLTERVYAGERLGQVNRAVAGSGA